MTDLFASVSLADGTFGCIDPENNFRAIDGTKIWPGKGPLRLVCKDKKYGFVDRDLAFHIAPTFDLANRVFHEELCRVKQDGKYGFINMAGELVVPCAFEKASVVFSHGRALVSEDGKKFGYVDTEGNVVTKFKYTADSHRFVNGYAAVQQGKKWGFIDPSGTEVIKPAYSSNYGRDFADCGIAAVAGGRGDNERIHYLRPDGSSITDLEVMSGSAFSDGLAHFMVSAGDRGEVRTGFFNESGEVAFWMERKSVQTGPVGSGYEPNEFREGLLAARDYKLEGYVCGYMDTTGEFAIEPAHRFTYQFCNGHAVVGNDDWQWAHIDREGRMLTDYLYDLPTRMGNKEPRNFSENTVATLLDDAYALMDTSGKLLTEFEFRSMGDMTNGFAQVLKDGLWGYVGADGAQAIECAYESGTTFQPWPQAD